MSKKAKPTKKAVSYPHPANLLELIDEKNAQILNLCFWNDQETKRANAYQALHEINSINARVIWDAAQKEK